MLKSIIFMGIFIDNKFYKKFDQKITILQFCLSKGISIPFFCYHDKLSIAGNCRICLVEANNLLVASCATLLIDNMFIRTLNRRIRLARESILEFLLVNHPLDCPICDQGGECDLQDIVLIYGTDKGRFYDLTKRSVVNINCYGPLIKTVMTRCIHCTRCVRFVNEISSEFRFGIIGRGSSLAISTYIEKYLYDEFMGNIIDICPVGALTSMPFAFHSRAWKLSSIRSTDVLDSIASSIRIDYFDNKVFRILPSLDSSLNSEWITNKTRFSYDSLNLQRIHYPKILLNKKFIILSWALSVYYYILNLFNFKYNYIQAIIGPFFDLNSCYNLKSFFTSFGCSNFSFYDNSSFNNLIDFRALYLLNKTIVSLDLINNFLFIGTNLRMELPILNKKIRFIYKSINPLINLYSFGLSLDYLSYPILNIGNSSLSLLKFIEGKFILNYIIFFYDFYNLNFFSFKNIKKLYFFIGMTLLNRIDSNSILLGFINLCNNLPSYNFEYINIIPKFLGRISTFELNVLPGLNSNMLLNKYNNLTFNHYCGIDLDISKIFKFDILNINVYQGPFTITLLMSFIWLILPTTLFTETYLFYYNLEGRLRLTTKVVSISSKIFNDCKIFYLLFFIKEILLPSNFSLLYDFYPIINNLNGIINYYHFEYVLKKKYATIIYKNLSSNFINILIISKWLNSVLKRTVFNIFKTDPFTKNSKLMNICSLKLKVSNFSNYFNNLNFKI